MSTRRVTIASLSMTDGTTTRYAIYRATLHYNLARSEPYVDLNRGAQHISTVTKDNRDKDSNWHSDDLTKRYLEMAAPFATPDAPAFAFTDCVFCYGTDPECRCARRSNIPKTESSSSLAASKPKPACTQTIESDDCKSSNYRQAPFPFTTRNFDGS